MLQSEAERIECELSFEPADADTEDNGMRNARVCMCCDEPTERYDLCCVCGEIVCPCCVCLNCVCSNCEEGAR